VREALRQNRIREEEGEASFERDCDCARRQSGRRRERRRQRKGGDSRATPSSTGRHQALGDSLRATAHLGDGLVVAVVGEGDDGREEGGEVRLEGGGGMRRESGLQEEREREMR
jgi:hypothetical protein